ncbi:MAG: RluA family pseudouridine synthase [Spirochaetae bacterium HGW-Spirochaetae-8]|jgi:23S rRNA pseudouridine1911/1915/1917 synthase|nr:MAG: RluA family pseudouridine synthase [Spirochaetae bacterium HGW-Spirochaetae-8]
MGRKNRTITFIAQEVPRKVRVDAYIASCMPELSRSLVGSIGTTITINGKVVKKSHPVQEGDDISMQWVEKVFDDIEPQDIPLSVLYEDETLLVIDKQQSLVVHPAAGNLDGTLVNALVFKFGTQFATEALLRRDTDVEDEDVEEFEVSAVRPGIVHRLDKDTSGVMVVAKTRQAHAALSQQFKDHTTEKFYIAIVRGFLPRRSGTIVASLIRDPRDRKRFTTCEEGVGKQAMTDYRVLRQFDGFSLVRLRLHTGRTHQIRIHMQFLGNPILGDPIYAPHDPRYPEATLMLHALSLAFEHPVTGERMRFCAPMPERFKNFLRGLARKALSKE